MKIEGLLPPSIVVDHDESAAVTSASSEGPIEVFLYQSREGYMYLYGVLWLLMKFQCSCLSMWIVYLLSITFLVKIKKHENIV